MNTSITRTPALPVTPAVITVQDAPSKGIALRTRINLLGYLVTPGCCALLGAILFTLSAQALRQSSLDDARGALEVIAQGNASLVQSGDLKTLQHNFDAFGQFPGIYGVLITDVNQLPVIAFYADERDWSLPELTQNARQLEDSDSIGAWFGHPWLTVQTPLLSENNPVGTLYLVWNLTRTQTLIYQLLFAIAAVFFLTLIFAIVLTRSLQRSLSNPVDELLSTTRAFAQNINTARYARIFAADELGELTQSFNTMLIRLLDQRRELNAARFELEHRAALRTTELETKHCEAVAARTELQLVIDQSLDVILLLDSDGLCKMVSPAITNILGYSQAEILNTDIHSLIYSKDRAGEPDQPVMVQEFLRQHGGKTRNTERRLRHRDGHWVWMEWSLTLQKNNQVFMVGRDIQDRKKKEVELMVAHKSESLARKHAQHIVDISLDMIVTADSAGRFLQVSQASERLIGYRPEELRGRLISEFANEEEFEGADIGSSLIKIVREAGGSLGGQAYRFRHKQGHWVWVEWSIVLQKEENTMYAVARDISERREYEQALIDARNQVQQVIDMSLDLIVTLDEKGIFLAVNAASKRLTGYGPSELIGTEILPLVNRDDMSLHTVKNLFDKMKSEGGILNGQVRRFRHKAGHWIWVEWNFVLENVDEDMHIHATGRDVTDRLHYEQELISSREIAETATATKSKFLANMSHEIRTPLNGVMGMLQLLSDTRVDVEQAGYLSTALNSGSALLTLINDVLDYSKIEARKLTLEAEPLNLLELLEDVAAMFGKPAAEKNVNLSTILDPQLSTHIVGDIIRLRQILTNLIGNAMKFTEQGEIVCHVSREVSQATTMLRFDISDTGIGIATDKLETIFGSFSQADDSTTREYGGTGLGLAISEQLVMLMGGSINVASSPGNGATFTFTLPLIAADAPAFGHEILESKRVLVIAETAPVREAISTICSRAGMQVTDLPVWQHNLHDLLADGSAFDLVIAGSELLANDLGARWAAQPTLPTLVIAPYGQSLDGLPDQFRQIYKPINSSQLMGFCKELLGLTAGNSVATSEVIQPSQGRILLVEDNPVNRKVATRILEKLGMEMIVAEDGQAALDQLANGPFDLVLMDCQMPVLDGYATTRQIRDAEKKSGHHQIIIALTANTEGEYRQHCLDAGMDDYLAKPYRIEALADILNRWLNTSPTGSSPSKPTTRNIPAVTA